GEGGDELFAGYARYAGERLSAWTRWLPNFASQAVRRGAGLLPGLRRGKLALHALTTADEAERYANGFPMFNDEAKRQLLTERMRDYRAGAGPRFAHHLANCDSREPLDRMLYVDSKQ